jgi:hypothetical protein
MPISGSTQEQLDGLRFDDTEYLFDAFLACVALKNGGRD